MYYIKRGQYGKVEKCPTSLKIVVINTFLLVMMAGIIEMLKLSVGCLDLVQMVQLL